MNNFLSCYSLKCVSPPRWTVIFRKYEEAQLQVVRFLSTASLQPGNVTHKCLIKINMTKQPPHHDSVVKKIEYE